MSVTVKRKLSDVEGVVLLLGLEVEPLAAGDLGLEFLLSGSFWDDVEVGREKKKKEKEENSQLLVVARVGGSRRESLWSTSQGRRGGGRARLIDHARAHCARPILRGTVSFSRHSRKKGTLTPKCRFLLYISLVRKEYPPPPPGQALKEWGRRRDERAHTHIHKDEARE